MVRFSVCVRVVSVELVMSSVSGLHFYFYKIYALVKMVDDSAIISVKKVGNSDCAIINVYFTNVSCPNGGFHSM